MVNAADAAVADPDDRTGPGRPCGGSWIKSRAIGEAVYLVSTALRDTKPVRRPKGTAAHVRHGCGQGRNARPYSPAGDGRLTPTGAASGANPGGVAENLDPAANRRAAFLHRPQHLVGLTPPSKLAARAKRERQPGSRDERGRTRLNQSLTAPAACGLARKFCSAVAPNPPLAIGEIINKFYKEDAEASLNCCAAAN
jgi:hypothetical protein